MREESEFTNQIINLSLSLSLCCCEVVVVGEWVIDVETVSKL